MRINRLGRLPRNRLGQFIQPQIRARPTNLLLPHALHKTLKDTKDGEEPHSNWKSGWSKFVEGGALSFGSVLVLGLAGYSYHMYYKQLTLSKLENAFAPGYSSLEMAALSRQASREDDDWVQRPEQENIDGIIDGTVKGYYYLITGEKGTGKTSMLLKAMKRIDGEGVAMLEAHGDTEIFRIRLGKALDYEFHEDYVGGMFSFKGPRDTTPLLDVERAFNKMEKIALKRKEAVGKPLILIINGAHLLSDNVDGRHLLELIQQRAELWASSNLVTVVLNSDEYWTAERLMGQATRLRIIPVRDIPKEDVISSLRTFRKNIFGEDVPTEILEQVFGKIGGRLRFLNSVAKAPDMIQACNAICEREKHWFLSQCWILGKTMDDADEEQQDFCAAAMVLAKAFVDKEKEMEDKSILPQMPLHEARQLVTRSSFIQHHDHLNIVMIDASSMMVQADSVAMQNAFRDIVSMEGFEELLQETLDRLDELESLGRTTEITLKDIWPGRGEYRAIMREEEDKDGKKHMVVSVKGVSAGGVK